MVVVVVDVVVVFAAAVVFVVVFDAAGVVVVVVVVASAETDLFPSFLSLIFLLKDRHRLRLKLYLNTVKNIGNHLQLGLKKTSKILFYLSAVWVPFDESQSSRLFLKDSTDKDSRSSDGRQIITLKICNVSSTSYLFILFHT